MTVCRKNLGRAFDAVARLIGPAQIVAGQSLAIERLVACLRRPVSTGGGADG